MNEVVAMLDKYLTCTKGLLASIFTVKNCCMNVRDDIVVLEQLKEFYVADLVKIFVNLNHFSYFIQWFCFYIFIFRKTSLSMSIILCKI